jgi:hypothetical protein
MELKRITLVKKTIILAFLTLSVAACHNDHDYSPKPRGYFRIVFPEKTYQQFNGPYPFTFIYPKYAYIEEDTMLRPQRKGKKLINS